jgi:hypothetical protein
MIPIMTYIIGLQIPIILLRYKLMLEIAVGPRTRVKFDSYCSGPIASYVLILYKTFNERHLWVVFIVCNIDVIRQSTDDRMHMNSWKRLCI